MIDIAVKPHLLTVRQVSIMIQVHPNTVLNYIHEGKLKGHNPNGDKKGLRITAESVKEYLKKYLLESFDEKIFEENLEKATQPEIIKPPTHKPHRPGGWVKGW